MDRKNGTFTHYLAPKATSSRERNVVDVLEDRRENLWVVTQWSWGTGKLNRLDPKTGQWIRYPRMIDVVALAEDDKRLWIATRNDLYCLAAATGAVTKFTDPRTGQGLSGIHNMLQDEAGNLWLNTWSGMVQINKARNKIRRFPTDRNNLLTGLYHGKRNFYQGPKGEVFFGALSGYYAFRPAQLHRPDTIPPQVVLRDLRLADQPVRPGPESPLREPLTRAGSIGLNHRQNVFSIGFAGIHYGQPELNQHLFRLEGYDNGWRQSGTEKTAYYYNIPPGQYVFRVRAANGDGIWAEKSLAVVVHPPWWRTWWAYGLYALALLTGTFGIVRQQRRRLIGKEREKARERELAQARQIEKAYEQLKATQTQLREQEQRAALYQQQLKIQQVRNKIAAELHDDIGSTLSSIHLFSEVAKKKINSDSQQALPMLEKIESSSQEMMQSMSEIVWAIQPKNDDTTHLVEKIHSFASQFLSASGIGFRFEYPDQFLSLPLGMEVRRNLYLIFKETLHNVAKHSGASQVEMTVELEAKSIRIDIRDNGRGFDRHIPSGGNGLTNLHRRAEEIGGKLLIDSRPGRGTRMYLECPLT